MQRVQYMQFLSPVKNDSVANRLFDSDIFQVRGFHRKGAEDA